MKALTINEKVTITKASPPGYNLDKFNFPVIKKTMITCEELDAVKFLNAQNASKGKDLRDYIILFFREDKQLKRYANNLFRYVAQYQTAFAIATPDFSIAPSMNKNEIQHNIFLNRWIGCWWQYYGCRIIPTIAWGSEETYDVCFSGIEPGGAVIVSTIGCAFNTEVFLQGYEEMMKRLRPSLIFVHGRVLSGMYGNICPINYNDGFERIKGNNLVQLPLFLMPKTINISRGECNG